MRDRKCLQFIYLVLAFSFLILLPQQVHGEITIIQKEIEEMLVCQDDCGMLVSACDNSTAQYMRGIIVEQINQGKTKEQILEYFIGIYGEKVLAAPPPKGFNITAWVTPFLMVLAGGLLIYFALEKWVFHNRLLQLEEVEQDNNLDLTEYEQRLEDELKEYW
ncbi:MAG: cytochrome c-type biosis protein CcmH [Clostridia bacterium]|jgi:cytochrome c-type biogenesis protein CcmH|nr:cytochrome c-type biosis protein CcmH [Clostridia bacterium]